MRLGPNYSQHVDRDKDGQVWLRVPLELQQEWSQYKKVIWMSELNDQGFNNKVILLPSKEYF